MKRSNRHMIVNLLDWSPRIKVVGPDQMPSTFWRRRRPTTNDEVKHWIPDWSKLAKIATYAARTCTGQNSTTHAHTQQQADRCYLIELTSWTHTNARENSLDWWPQERMVPVGFLYCFRWYKLQGVQATYIYTLGSAIAILLGHDLYYYTVMTSCHSWTRIRTCT